MSTTRGIYRKLLWGGFGMVLLGTALMVWAQSLFFGVLLAIVGLFFIILSAAIGGVDSPRSPIGTPR